MHQSKLHRKNNVLQSTRFACEIIHLTCTSRPKINFPSFFSIASCHFESPLLSLVDAFVFFSTARKFHRRTKKNSLKATRKVNWRMHPTRKKTQKLSNNKLRFLRAWFLLSSKLNEKLCAMHRLCTFRCTCCCKLLLALTHSPFDGDSFINFTFIK